jgi:hypothetical protein
VVSCFGQFACFGEQAVRFCHSEVNLILEACHSSELSKKNAPLGGGERGAFLETSTRTM